jgi:oligosaccharide repeat unit polymerase
LKRHPYIIATIIATLLAVVVWLCVPKEYSAVTKVSDEYKEVDLAIGMNSITARMKEAMGGANTGMNDMEVYCKVLYTEDFARSIAHKQVPGKQMTYGEYLGKKDTIEAVRSHIVYNYSGRQATLAISFSDRDPLVASQMLDSVTAQLQQVVTQSRHRMAEAQLRNAQEEMRQAKADYQAAQKTYNEFIDAHGKLATKEMQQQEQTLAKEAKTAYQQYDKAIEQCVRQEALTQRSFLSFAVVENNTVPQRPNSYLLSYLLSFVIIALLLVRGVRLWQKRRSKLNADIDFGGLFSPWALTLMIWAAILGLYYALDTDLYPISSQFYGCFAIWVPIFCISSFFTYHLSMESAGSTGGSFDYNKVIFNFFFIVSMVMTPLYVYRVLQIVMMFSTDDLMNNLRTLAVYGEGQGFLNHSSVINQALFVVALWAYPKVPLWQVVLVGIACLLGALAIMEKGTMFFVFICIMFVLFEKKVIRLRTIIFSGILLIMFFFFFNTLRTTNEDYDASDDTLIDFIMMYILSPPVAFSQLSTEVTPQFGSNTFETIYHFLRRLGVTGIVEKEKIQEFVFVPISTNVYTIFQPFYIDFGYRGIAFFSMVYGVVCGWLYRLYQNRENVGICLYTFFVQILILQFYQENVFMSIVFVFEFAFFVLLSCQKMFKFSLTPKL